MTAPETMTRADRDTLVKIVRQRERVAKTEAKERTAHLMADFERQLDRTYSFNENEIWDAATRAANAAVAEAKLKIAEECEKLGIPKEFAPGLNLGWYGKGQNASKDRCAELRRIAQREVDAAEKSARTAIEKRSLEMQEKIMASMPTIEALMPVLDMGRVEGMIEHKRGRYDD
jgi:hypothetical protein